MMRSLGGGMLGLFMATGACIAACKETPPPPAPTAPPPRTATPTASAPAAKPAGLRFDIGALDTRADPCVDFYDYACGGWRAAHPVPPDQSRWDRYSEMVAVNLEHERSIVEDAMRAGPTATPAEQRVGAYYAACMDEAGIDARGLAPVRDELAKIDAIKTARDAMDAITDFHVHWVEAVFATYPDTAPRDSARRVLWIDRGKLSLPDPSDYSKTDDAAVALRAKYVEHLTRLFGLAGLTPDDAKAAAAKGLAFETSLAKSALSAADRRQREKQDHPMKVAELAKRWPAIDWKTYFTKLGVPAIDAVNVAQPAWMDAVNAALSSKDLAGVQAYLRMQALRPTSAVLPSAIEAEVFDFHQRTLRGAKEMAPRWRRCLKLVDEDLGDDVGRIFLARYFDDAARARMKSMVEALTGAFRADFDSSAWLDPAAREAAKTKLADALIVIGSSNRPRSFDGLKIERDDPYGNRWRAQAFDLARVLGELGKPADREEFFDDLPQELDAFGSKSQNATGFTAGFLQPPIFDPTMDDAVNYGGVGSVIGHELSHKFDDEGRKYDARGNIRPWWSDAVVKAYEERAQCFVDEYSRFHIDDGTALDGKLTLGENIADNGGIRLSYSALHPSESGPKIDGFTPAQRFFLAWGQIRCENVTPEAAKRQVTTDEHSPGRWRVNGVVSNMPEFASAFACKAGAPMAPEKRCAVW